MSHHQIVNQLHRLCHPIQYFQSFFRLSHFFTATVIPELETETVMAQDEDVARLAALAFGGAVGDESYMDMPSMISLAPIAQPFLALIPQNLVAVDGARGPIGARGAWTQQEDDSLRAAVAQLGPRKWSDIAKFVPSRTPKQCRERWFDRLAPNLKRDPFDQREDALVIEKQKEYGNRWAAIAAFLPGRSAGAVKNRWYSCLKNQAGNRYAMRMDPEEAGMMLHLPADNQPADL